MERENYGKWNSFLWGPMNAQFWIHAVSQILKLNIVHLLYSIRDNISQCEISWWLCVFSCVFCFLFFFPPWILLSLCFFHCLRAGKAAFKKLGKKKKKSKAFQVTQWWSVQRRGSPIWKSGLVSRPRTDSAAGWLRTPGWGARSSGPAQSKLLTSQFSHMISFLLDLRDTTHPTLILSWSHTDTAFRRGS